METMAGRVAVVTGAASGIGRALALGFAANLVLALMARRAATLDRSGSVAGVKL